MSQNIPAARPPKLALAIAYKRAMPTEPIRSMVPKNALPEILFLTSYPPRECGIATYSYDLIAALNAKFSRSFQISVCALETNDEQPTYTHKPAFRLNTHQPNSFAKVAFQINKSPNIQLVVIQHEFGFFAQNEDAFRAFFSSISAPIVFVFHTVLPAPNTAHKQLVDAMMAAASFVVTMTQSAAQMLQKYYVASPSKISIIPHGTHLVPHLSKITLKQKYLLKGKFVLSTFGLLSNGKNIETTLKAMPAIVAAFPNVVFLIIGKTHPTVAKQQGETYRNMLTTMVADLHLENNVKFINAYLPLPQLLEYLQLTDIYLFTSNDPNQAVSGTFVYAVSCGCPIISTPIPHAVEVLKNGSGVIIDFANSTALSAAAITLLADETLRHNISLNGLHQMAFTAWENAAIAHANLFRKVVPKSIDLQYNLPPINLAHFKKLTTGFGMLQFSIINLPNPKSGYTLDDNARALVAISQYHQQFGDPNCLLYIKVYLDFIKFCLQPDGSFLNYVDAQFRFTSQNDLENLEDSNGRAIWALGYVVSIQHLLPSTLANQAASIMNLALPYACTIRSTRAMAFVIKGIYYCNLSAPSIGNLSLTRKIANRLVQMYKHESEPNWLWFESYLTYGNSILPEALLCAWLTTGDHTYKAIALASFEFLLSKTFSNNAIHVVSNRGWLPKKHTAPVSAPGGEQPIDVAYTIIALKKFYHVFKNDSYKQKMQTAFNWFLGNNHLKQIIYNPCTGGCYDGLEENYVNLNQGAESTVSYLMARLAIEQIEPRLLPAAALMHRTMGQQRPTTAPTQLKHFPTKHTHQLA
jgi:glycosyltransferase involved in cell wall biosynthesis